MIIFPAIDIMQGKAVRLRQGKADDVTVFSDNPVSTALQWQSEEGITHLHLVDLDGAFDGKTENTKIVEAICKELKIKVQLGGGIRSLEIAKKWIDAGVSRLIIGTLAFEEPDTFAKMCSLYPGKVGVSLDADKGQVMTRGWVTGSNQTVDQAIPSLSEAGAAFFVYTDISRDGMNLGVNLESLEHVCKISPVPVIASGGVSSIKDIKDLYPLSLSANLEGAIVGRAIYEGNLTLSDAINYINDAKK